MPLVRSPLLNPKALKEALSRFALPADLKTRRAIIESWLAASRSGRLTAAKEKNLQGEFLQRIFGDVLGYRSMTQSPDAWELVSERTSGPHGLSSDGAIGFFGPEGEQVLAPIELKAARQPLDVAVGRALTPIQQGWNYANHTPGCRWVIVSNFRETRLYSTRKTPGTYEVIHLEELESEDGLKRFFLLFSRPTLLPSAPGGRSAVDELLEASEHVQKDVTNRLYGEYRDLRGALYADLVERNPARDPVELLSSAQTLLDRVLFIAFAEDRKLLPERTIARAAEHRDAYREAPTWENFQAVFRWIDKGNLHHRIPPYNGGLFRQDPRVDQLAVSDEMCERFKSLGEYDFRDEVSVEVLGHIFEQSIADLEELRAEAAKTTSLKLSKRKAEGVFYTPTTVTQFLVEETLGAVLREREALEFSKRKTKTLKEQIHAWEAYRAALAEVRVLDPACGSGAFLIAAFDVLAREYERVNATLAELRRASGQTDFFDLTTTILNNNLFGVDLNGESVEITKLSLWLKTAEPGRKLTYLDSNIKAGNSVVEDAALDARAFDWTRGKRHLDVETETTAEAGAIEARWREKFDVVISNPPYVRQELLKPIKSHLQTQFATFHGMADLFVYFFERSIQLLKPGGRMGFIVSNKWLKAEYAEPLRRYLREKSEVERLIDFGHAPIFPDADAFPSIITVREPGQGPDATREMEATLFPREELGGSVGIREYVTLNSHHVRQANLRDEGWSIEPPAVDALMNKLRQRGTPLAEYLGSEPFYGLKTGLNEAYLISEEEQQQLANQSPASHTLTERFLRGQDIARWAAASSGYLIALKSSGDHRWPWSGISPEKAEARFQETYPAVHAHMKRHEAALRKRSDQGQYWWELRSCDYYDDFEKPKIVYQEIQFHPAYALDDEGLLLNNKAFGLRTGDPWLLAVLNSPVIWWFNWRHLAHMKDEALSPAKPKMRTVPIAPIPKKQKGMVEAAVPRLRELTREVARSRQGMLDALHLQFSVTASARLERFEEATTEGFLKEATKKREKGKTLRPNELAALRTLHLEESARMRERLAKARELEDRIAAAVFAAYKLTEAELRTLWAYAPVRMPGRSATRSRGEAASAA